MALVDSSMDIYTRRMVKVLIVDSHDLVRWALENRLKTAVGLSVVGSTGYYESAVQQARQYKPDIILLESKAPTAIETIKALSQALPNCAIIVLTSYPDSKEEDTVIQMGASRYLLKTLNTRLLVKEIRNLARQMHHFNNQPIKAAT